MQKPNLSLRDLLVLGHSVVTISDVNDQKVKAYNAQIITDIKLNNSI